MVNQIKDISGNVIFEDARKYNSLKDIVERAIENGVSLANADLSFAHLNFTDFTGANLKGANFKGAYLRCADFRNANVSGVDFSGANLSYAYFRYANLRDANFNGANLYSARLILAKNIPNNIPMTCPKSGSFIGWKKVRGRTYDYLIKLEIPADAERSSATSEKCRCSKAKVLEITNINTDKNVKEITNRNYTACIYRVGEIVYPDFFDNDRWNECSHGIHFFMDKKDAIKY